MNTIKDAFSILYFLASVDGSVDERELQIIVDFTNRQHGLLDFDPRPTIAELARLTGAERTAAYDRALFNFRDNSGMQDRNTLMHFAADLAAADGEISANEKILFQDMAKVWGINMHTLFQQSKYFVQSAAAPSEPSTGEPDNKTNRGYFFAWSLGSALSLYALAAASLNQNLAAVHFENARAAALGSGLYINPLTGITDDMGSNQILILDYFLNREGLRLANEMETKYGAAASVYFYIIVKTYNLLLMFSPETCLDEILSLKSRSDIPDALFQPLTAAVRQGVKYQVLKPIVSEFDQAVRVFLHKRIGGEKNAAEQNNSQENYQVNDSKPAAQPAQTQAATTPNPSETLRAPREILAAYCQKRADTYAVMRSLVSYDGWLVPIELFAAGNENKRRVNQMLMLSTEKLAVPEDTLWIFTDEQAAFQAQAKHPYLGTFGGGMSGTELFCKIPPAVKNVLVNPGSPAENSWFFQDGGGIEAARMWAKVIALENLFAEWNQNGAFDGEKFAGAAFIMFSYASGGLVTLAYEAGRIKRVAVFSAPDCAAEFTAQFDEKQRAQFKEVHLKGETMLKQLSELGFAGFVVNVVGPGVTFVHDFAQKSVSNQTVQMPVELDPETPYSKNTPDNAAQAEEFFNFGLKNFQSGNFDVALLDFSSAIQLKPDYTDAYQNRGMCFFSLKNFDEAIKEFDKVLGLNPNNFQVLHFRGIAHSRRGEYALAVADLTKAAELDDSNTDVFFQRGVAYTYLDGLENYDSAVQDFDKVIALAPDYHHGYSYRGLCYYEKGDFDNAVRDCDKAIELLNDNTFAYLNRAKSFSKKGDFDKAIKDFDKAIELLPGEAEVFAEVFYDRGNCFLKQGKYDQAVKDLTESIRLGYSELYRAYHNRAVAYREQCVWDDAIEDFSRSIELNPDCFDSYLNRGAIYAEQKSDYDQAIKDFTQAVRLDPNSIAAYQNRALIFEKKGYSADAEADGRKIDEIRNFLKDPQLYGLVDYSKM
jgi:tetratricopeptide (TPR) repeat protein/tellurite resistance protein